MDVEIRESKATEAQALMDLDKDYLEQLDPEGKPILHLYEWLGPSATYGYFVDPYKYLSKEGVKKVGLHLGKRPTGGGIVFHIADYAFSCLVPSKHPRFSLNTLKNYALINSLVVAAVQKIQKQKGNLELLPHEPKPQTPDCMHFCMAKATKYDVMLHGKKIGGAAQRRKKQGFLHQGTISLALLPKDFLAQVLLPERGVLEAMQENTYCFLEKGWSFEQLEILRASLKEALKEAFIELFSTADFV